MSQQVWSVTTLTRYLKNSLERDAHIQSILVKGEISNFTAHRSGHFYFSLKDEGGKMNCVMFSSHARLVQIPLKEGVKVIVKAKVSMYEPMGSIQLYVSQLQSDGVGDLYLRYEMLKKKLHAQGMFDIAHKKVLPKYAQNIAVVTASSGAAIQDVLSVLARRWPMADVHVYPSLVQGEQAAASIIAQLEKADTNAHDVILLVRGGGSLEDLYCFNDEQLAHTIFSMNTCIISGVGHESDTTLVDYVSDLRAATPSAAAQMATPDYNEVKQQCMQSKMQIQNALQNQLAKLRNRLEVIQEKRYFRDPQEYTAQQKLRVMMAYQGLMKMETILNEVQYKYQGSKQNYLYLKERFVRQNKTDLAHKQEFMKQQLKRLLLQERNALQSNIALMDAYSPLKILQRGYAIAQSEGHILSSVENIKEGQEIQIKFSDGIVKTTVEEVKKDGK